jgi:hypothetical protein
VDEAHAAQARAEAEHRAAAEAREARYQEIRQLPQLAKQLAAKAAAAHVVPRDPARLIDLKTAWRRKRDPDGTFSGWQVYRWNRRPSRSASETYSVLLTTDGLLVAFRYSDAAPYGRKEILDPEALGYHRHGV